MIDFDREGRPIGIEITAPAEVSLTLLNNTLRSLGPLVKKADLAPTRCGARVAAQLQRDHPCVPLAWLWMSTTSPVVGQLVEYLASASRELQAELLSHFV